MVRDAKTSLTAWEKKETNKGEWWVKQRAEKLGENASLWKEDFRCKIVT